MHLRDRINHPDLQVTILHLAVFLCDLERNIMSALTDLQTSVATNSDLVSQLISIKGGTAPSGAGASDTDLAGLQATIDANNTALQNAISAASAPTDTTAS